jgi:hypothetical protein
VCRERERERHEEIVKRMVNEEWVRKEDRYKD